MRKCRMKLLSFVDSAAFTDFWGKDSGVGMQLTSLSTIRHGCSQNHNDSRVLAEGRNGLLQARWRGVSWLSFIRRTVDSKSDLTSSDS